MILATFCLFIFIMIVIGGIASFFSKSSSDDYILAGRGVGSIATALSAVSTCHSGFMFIGMIGFTYKYGIMSIWMILGWLFGDYIAWTYIYPKLRHLTESKKTLTLPEFVTSHLHNNERRIIQIIVSVILFIFVGFYAGAQLIAGSKALTIFLDLSQVWGIFLGGIVVLVYSVSGGIRASIWTDVIQSIIMIIAMFGLVGTVLFEIGGIHHLFIELKKIDPSLVNLFDNVDLWFLFYVFGWCAFGIGVIGQPHILTRPMAIKSVQALKPAKTIYFAWYTLFSLAALLVGLSARVLIPELISADTELALPLLATNYLPSFFVGIILAGIFSACISTADSQILVCSSTLTQIFFSKNKNNIVFSRLVTFFTLTLIIIFSIVASKSVFFLVVFSWSVLGLIFTPFVVTVCFNIMLNYRVMIMLIVTSFSTIIIWVHFLQLSNKVNEVLPGFLMLTFIIYIAVKKNSKSKIADRKDMI